MVDYFSRYPEVQALNSTTSSSITKALKNIFSQFGIPEVVISGNGPQYASNEFAEIAKAYDFKHVTCSPPFAQSNGQVEQTIQTLKRFIKESKGPYTALLVYKSTPIPWCKLSPAELLMERCLCSNIPILKEQLTPEWKYPGEFRKQNLQFKCRQKQDYDSSHGVCSLTPIPNNTNVWITSGDEPVHGTVVSTADAPRSYMVETPSGQLRRNQQHLNVVPENTEQLDQSETQMRDPIMTIQELEHQLFHPTTCKHFWTNIPRRGDVE